MTPKLLESAAFLMGYLAASHFPSPCTDAQDRSLGMDTLSPEGAMEQMQKWVYFSSRAGFGTTAYRVWCKQELLSQREQTFSADQKPDVLGKQSRKCYSPDLFRIVIFIWLEHYCAARLCLPFKDARLLWKSVELRRLWFRSIIMRNFSKRGRR